MKGGLIMEEDKIETKEVVEQDVKDIVTAKEFVNEHGVVLSRRDLNDDELTRKKLELESIKIQVAKVESDLKQAEQQLDIRLPEKFIQDDIDRIDKAILERKIKDDELTDADIEEMKIRKEALLASLEADIPMRELRLRINQMRFSLEGPDNPNRQIKTLEKQIRERAENFVTGNQMPIPSFVG